MWCIDEKIGNLEEGDISIEITNLYVTFCFLSDKYIFFNSSWVHNPKCAISNLKTHGFNEISDMNLPGRSCIIRLPGPTSGHSSHGDGGGMADLASSMGSLSSSLFETYKDIVERQGQ